MTYILGLDIGGTKIEGALIKVSENQKINVIERQRVPTLRERGYTPVLKDIKNLIEMLLQNNSLSKESLNGIGIGLPGTVSPVTKQMINGNSQIFIDQNIVVDLNKALQTNIRIEVENDASCFALAEAYSGAGLKFQEDFKIPVKKQIGIGVIIGTGCGGGIVYHGTVLSGKMGGAGEIGHTKIVSNGVECYCGRTGCAESYLSGSGVERIYNECTGMRKSSKDIFDLALTKEDENAVKIIEEYKDNLTTLLLNLSNIFDPHYIVLGGGVSNRDEIYNDVQNRLIERAFLTKLAPKLYKHFSGDSAGVIGSAMLLLNELN